MEKEEANDLKNLLDAYNKQLVALLASPLFPKGFNFRFPTNTMLEETLTTPQQQNAVQAMKSAMETGTIKKLKKATKNEALLKLGSAMSCKETNGKSSDKTVTNGEKLSKNKWKKLRRNKAEATN